MKYDVLVVGSGIWGSTVARILAEAGKRILVLEQRAHVGGNARCEIDPETNIEVHLYGSHIFHTRNPEVWSFVRRFAEFNGYQHKVLTKSKGKTYTLPIGLNLINKFFGVELLPKEVDLFLDEGNRREALFETFFRGYTCKQWGRTLDQIDPSVIKRIPVRKNYDVNYFYDSWQGIPIDGYNCLFDRLLDHQGIEVQCNTKFSLSLLSELKCPKVFYSGPIDELFSYKFGPLSWRTLRFEREWIDEIDFQGTSVVNYPDVNVPFTRVHEFKHYHPEPVGPLSQAENLKGLARTIVSREYSDKWSVGDEPFYPINTPESEDLFCKYQEELRHYPEITVGGRLGSYRYLDMDQAMASALETARQFLKEAR